jgi:Ca2+-binding EF-hand superfamily protein
MFKFIDFNGNGSLTLNEMLRIFKEVDPKIKAKYVQDIMDNLDLNNKAEENFSDSNHFKLSFTQFLIAAQENFLTDENLLKTFEDIDQNSKGVINKKDF